MDFKSHLAVGTAVAFVLYGCSDPTLNIAYDVVPILASGACMAGSVIPDIDHPKSVVGQEFRPISRLIALLQKPFGKTGPNHRGLCHDIGFATIFLIISYFVHPILFGFFLGVMVHLGLDALNPAGVPCFIGKKIHLLPKKLRMNSGGFFSTSFSLLLACGIIGVFIITKTAMAQHVAEYMNL